MTGPIEYLTPEDAQIGDQCKPDRRGLGTVERIDLDLERMFIRVGKELVETDLASLPINRTLPRNAPIEVEPPRPMSRDQVGPRDQVVARWDVPSGWRNMPPGCFPAAVAVLVWVKPTKPWLWAYVEHTPNGPMLHSVRGLEYPEPYQPMRGDVAAWLLAEYARIAATWETHTDGQD